MSEKYTACVYFGHDASLAIVGGGKIWHYELERFDRKKHSGNSGLFRGMLTELLRDAGVKIEQVVAIGGVGGGDCYSSTRIRNFWNNMNETDTSSTNFFGPNLPVHWTTHHMAHALYTFYTSPFEKANVFAIDAGGDAIAKENGDLYIPTTGAGIAEHKFGNSESVFKLNCETKRGSPGGSWSSRSREWYGDEYSAGTVMAAVAIKMRERLKFSPEIPESALHQFKQVQSETNYFFNWLRDDYREYPNVCLGGGVALNGVAANTLLLRKDTDNVFTAPAANDGGLAIGGALFALHRILKVPRVPYTTKVVSFAGLDCGTPEESIDIDKIVTKLANNEIVAVCVGRAESGPRALGHRSILSNPSAPGIKDKINQLKGRQPFRPVAPVLCIDKLPEGTVEESTLYKSPKSMEFMTVIPEAPRSMLNMWPDACHLDGTIRAQVVTSDHILGKIIMELGRRTGVYCVLNTSLNGKGEPIVNTREEAICSTGKMGIELI